MQAGLVLYSHCSTQTKKNTIEKTEQLVDGCVLLFLFLLALVSLLRKKGWIVSVTVVFGKPTQLCGQLFKARK